MLLFFLSVKEGEGRWGLEKCCSTRERETFQELRWPPLKGPHSGNARVTAAASDHSISYSLRPICSDHHLLHTDMWMLQHTAHTQMHVPQQASKKFWQADVFCIYFLSNIFEKMKY